MFFGPSSGCNLTARFPWKESCFLLLLLFFFHSKMVKKNVSIPHWPIGQQFSLTHASQLDAVEMTSSACFSETPHVEKGGLFR